jgi:hypothetical protein
VIVFLARDFGGVRLGKDRYTIINKVVAQALGRYNAALQRNPAIQHPARLHVFTSAPPFQQLLPQSELQAAPSAQSNDNAAQQANPEDVEGEAAPDKQDKDDKIGSNEDSSSMDVDTQDGANTDKTKHKLTYKGTPIKQGHFGNMGSGAGLDNNERGSYKPPPPHSHSLLACHLHHQIKAQLYSNRRTMIVYHCQLLGRAMSSNK